MTVAEDSAHSSQYACQNHEPEIVEEEQRFRDLLLTLRESKPNPEDVQKEIEAVRGMSAVTDTTKVSVRMRN
jgi:hypothetical protein